jgi:hypothetical protein
MEGSKMRFADFIQEYVSQRLNTLQRALDNPHSKDPVKNQINSIAGKHPALAVFFKAINLSDYKLGLENALTHVLESEYDEIDEHADGLITSLHDKLHTIYELQWKEILQDKVLSLYNEQYVTPAMTQLVTEYLTNSDAKAYPEEVTTAISTKLLTYKLRRDYARRFVSLVEQHGLELAKEKFNEILKKDFIPLFNEAFGDTQEEQCLLRNKVKVLFEAKAKAIPAAYRTTLVNYLLSQARANIRELQDKDQKQLAEYLQEQFTTASSQFSALIRQVETLEINVDQQQKAEIVVRAVNEYVAKNSTLEYKEEVLKPLIEQINFIVVDLRPAIIKQMREHEFIMPIHKIDIKRNFVQNTYQKVEALCRSAYDELKAAKNTSAFENKVSDKVNDGFASQFVEEVDKLLVEYEFEYGRETDDRDAAAKVTAVKAVKEVLDASAKQPYNTRVEKLANFLGSQQGKQAIDTLQQHRSWLGKAFALMGFKSIFGFRSTGAKKIVDKLETCRTYILKTQTATNEVAASQQHGLGGPLPATPTGLTFNS